MAELKRTRRAPLSLTAAAVIAVVLPNAVTSAQVIRGTVRTQRGESLVVNARVTATDSVGATVAEAASDSLGRFRLAVTSGQKFKVNVMKLGWVPSSSDWVTGAPSDTLEFDVLVPADPNTLPAVNVKGAMSLNERRFEEATRRGWAVYGPEVIEQHRNTGATFLELLREVGATGVLIDDHPQFGAVRGRANGPGGACVRSARTNRCLVVVVDDVPSGYTPPINARDIYFMAILTASESASRWGQDAPWGAIVVYTRMNGDKKSP